MDEARPNLPGPRKIGKKAFEKRQKEKVNKSRPATVYGRRKGGPVAAEEKPYPFEKANGNPITISSLKELLAEKPELLGAAIEYECSLDDPRKGAVEHLLELEQGRDEGPREDVVQLLQAFLD